MDIRATSVCSGQEITMLSSHGKDSLAAMKDLCKRVYPYGGSKPYSFYIFSEALKHDGSPLNAITGNYGKNFAALIRELNVGELVESPIKKNDAFHPDHSNIFWIWSPDPEKLKNWWKQNDPKHEQFKKAEDRINNVVARMKAKKEEAIVPIAVPIIPEMAAPFVVELPKIKRKRKLKPIDPFAPVKPKRKLGLRKKKVVSPVYRYWEY